MKADICSRSEGLRKDLLRNSLMVKALSMYRLSSLFYCEKTTHPESQSTLLSDQLEAHWAYNVFQKTVQNVYSSDSPLP